MPYRAFTRIGKMSITAYSDPDSDYLREGSTSISLEDIVFDADGTSGCPFIRPTILPTIKLFTHFPTAIIR